jgi:hypothetical protein
VEVVPQGAALEQRLGQCLEGIVRQYDVRGLASHRGSGPRAQRIADPHEPHSTEALGIFDGALLTGTPRSQPQSENCGRVSAPMLPPRA